jgi:hypothetical protein
VPCRQSGTVASDSNLRTIKSGLARGRTEVFVRWACQTVANATWVELAEFKQLYPSFKLVNFVMHSRTNRRAVVEAGGNLIVQEFLLSPNVDISGQASLLIKEYLFSNHTLPRICVE